MHNEANTNKKKRIILSTNRKSTAKCTSVSKEPIDTFNQQNNQEIINCASINNSLEIFQDDPKNRHFHFLENQEDKVESDYSNQMWIQNQEYQLAEKTRELFYKNKKSHYVPLQGTNTDFSKILITNPSKQSQVFNPKKFCTSPNRKYIDLTLKRSSSKILTTNKSSNSFFSNRPQQNSCTLQNYQSRSTQRSILSSVSVSSLHLTIVNRATSQRKKPTLTITCHKYKQEQSGKRMKEQSGINKCSSIKLFKKCI